VVLPLRSTACPRRPASGRTPRLPFHLHPTFPTYRGISVLESRISNCAHGNRNAAAADTQIFPETTPQPGERSTIRNGRRRRQWHAPQGERGDDLVRRGSRARVSVPQAARPRPRPTAGVRPGELRRRWQDTPRRGGGVRGRAPGARRAAPLQQHPAPAPRRRPAAAAPELGHRRWRRGPPRRRRRRRGGAFPPRPRLRSSRRDTSSVDRSRRGGRGLRGLPRGARVGGEGPRAAAVRPPLPRRVHRRLVPWERHMPALPRRRRRAAERYRASRGRGPAGGAHRRGRGRRRRAAQWLQGGAGDGEDA
jgi:hypothetical protein